MLNRYTLAEDDAQATDGLLLPEGHYIDLPGRGRCFYREIPNPGKPSLVLLHGMFCSALTNWYRCFHHLAPHFHIIAPDLRGHGRSFHNSRSFRLRSCAKDISALLNALDVHDAILVGYSMGGAVVQHVMQIGRAHV